MSTSPMLRIKHDSGRQVTCSIADAKPMLTAYIGLVVVEGEAVRSYDELVKLASRKPYRDRELLHVYLVPPVAGG